MRTIPSGGILAKLLAANAFGILFLALSTFVVTGCSNQAGDTACTTQSQCPQSYLCVRGACVEQCQDNSDCSDGRECSNNLCVDPDIDQDATIGDTPNDGNLPDVPAGTVVGPDGRPIEGGFLLDPCSDSEPCRTGLTCSAAGSCEAGGILNEGDLCIAAGDCSDGLTCSIQSRCVLNGDSVEGGACSLPEDCVNGLRCELLGAVGVCLSEGNVDVGGDCTAHGECVSPLFCSAGVCQIPAFSQISTYDGRTCSETTGPFRVHFEVPRDEPLGEFYRLPYPNDIRRTTDGIDMSGHPAPELTDLGGGVVLNYIDALADRDMGFSTNPTIFFRMSGNFDFSTVRGGDDATLRFVNIDPQSPGRGSGPPIFWFMTTGRGKYICNNYLAIHPSWSRPLDHGTTYAVLLTNGLRGGAGAIPVQDDDLTVLLDDAEPADNALFEAWESYQVFRDFLDDEDIDPITISAATVFTTMDPDEDIPGIYDAVQDAVTPNLQNLELCENTGNSGHPCHDDNGRACITQSDDGYYEIHATYQAPVWQQGDRPYLTPDDGGGLVFNNGGQAQANVSEVMCLSMTVPSGPNMPTEGWPVVMYAHGTGGDYLSHIRGGHAERVSDVNLDGGDRAAIISVSIDGVQHGPRRGGSEIDPEVLFFNFLNPAAALGNVQQGVADYFMLTRLLASLDLSSGQSPTGEAIRIDTDNIYFFGHSQGATIGAPFVAYEPGVRAAVFSGAGGSLVLSLLNKTSPVDIASAVNQVLDDGSLNDTHPVLSLLQQWIDPVDPLNYGNLIVRAPPGSIDPTHIFMSMGEGDSYTPNVNTEVFARSMGLHLATPPDVEVAGLASTELPVSGNRRYDNDDYTAVLLTYLPDGDYDGHFVISRHPDGIRQSLHFLGSAVEDGTPLVPE